MATASLALGLGGLLGIFCCLTVPLSGAGAVIGFIALSKNPEPGSPGRGRAIAGIVLSLLGLVLWVVSSVAQFALPMIFNGP